MCWEQPPREGWHKWIAMSIPAASRGACDSTPSSSSALLRGHGPLTTLWLGRKSSSTSRKSSTIRPGLGNAFRKGSPGKCQGCPPHPVGSSKQLILCRRQLQGREVLMVCMPLLLLLQPWGCLLQPTARNFQAILLQFTRDLLIAWKC